MKIFFDLALGDFSCEFRVGGRSKRQSFLNRAKAWAFD